MSRQRRRSGAGGGHLKTKWCTFIYTEYQLMLPRRRPVTWCCVQSCCGPESAWRRHAGALLKACKTARTGNQIFKSLLILNVRYLQDFFRITNKEINEWMRNNDKCPAYPFNRLSWRLHVQTSQRLTRPRANRWKKELTTVFTSVTHTLESTIKLHLKATTYSLHAYTHILLTNETVPV